LTVTHRAAVAAPGRLTFVQMALWALPVLALLIYSGGWELPLVGETADAAGSALLRVGYLPAYAAGFALIALRPGSTLRTLIRQPFLIVLLLVAVASVFWSVNPDQTARRGFALVCTTLGGIALAARFRWPQLAEVVGAAFAVLIVACFVVCLAVPRIGIMTELFPGAWRGLWREKNGLGGNMAFGFCILSAAALLNPRRARLWWTFAGLALVLVLMSTSKTSLVSLMLGVAAIGFVWIARRGPALGAAATWTGITGVVLLGAFILFASDVFFAILGKDATLTGRTKIWAAVMREIEDRPWLGYGYQAVWGDRSGWGSVRLDQQERRLPGPARPQQLAGAMAWHGLARPGRLGAVLPAGHDPGGDRRVPRPRGAARLPVPGCLQPCGPDREHRGDVQRLPLGAVRGLRGQAGLPGPRGQGLGTGRKQVTTDRVAQGVGQHHFRVPHDGQWSVILGFDAQALEVDDALVASEPDLDLGVQKVDGVGARIAGLADVEALDLDVQPQVLARRAGGQALVDRLSQRRHEVFTRRFAPAPAGVDGHVAHPRARRGLGGVGAEQQDGGEADRQAGHAAALKYQWSGLLKTPPDEPGMSARAVLADVIIVRRPRIEQVQTGAGVGRVRGLANAKT
jgi:exopolysaccharide production protein ExoQ